MKQYIYTITLLASVFILSACNDNMEDKKDVNKKKLFSFPTLTRSDEQMTDRTYNISLFDLSGMNEPCTGSYYDKSGETYMIPCSLNVNGMLNDNGKKDISSALFAPAGSYSMLVVSPGIKPEQSAEESLYWGYRLKRGPGYKTYIGSSIDVNVDGISIKNPNSSDNGYIYKFDSDYKLKQPLSKIKLTIKCKEDNNPYTISSLSYTDLIKECLFNYKKGYLDITSEELSPYKNDGEQTFPIVINSTTEREMECTSPIGNDNCFYILSADYSIKDESYKILAPKLKIVFKDGKKEKEPVIVELARNFEPQHTYTLSVSLSHTYITVDIKKSDWDGNSADGDIGDTGVETIVIGKKGDNWEQIGSTGTV